MKTKKLILCGLFAALTAVFSQLAMPLPFSPVSVSFATLAVFVSGGVLGFKYGILSQLIYIFLGIAGAPVFSHFSGGIGHLISAGGGYITGYVLCAGAIGILTDKFCQSRFHYALACLTGLLCCYISGTLQFMIITGTPTPAAALSCVLPFIPADILKIFIAAHIIYRLR